MNANGLVVWGLEGRKTLPAELTIAAGRKHTAETILRAWYENKSPLTIRSYAHDLENFTLFLSRALRISPILKVPEALRFFFRQSSPSAHEIVICWRNCMVGSGLAPASVSRQIATRRSLTKLARMLGMCTWSVELPGVRIERRRPTMGPTVQQIVTMLEATAGDSEGETRDYAIIVTFYATGLRVSELCGLNLHECDLVAGNAWIKGKGRKEKELVPLPAVVIAAIQRYLPYRGTAAGPLFLTRGNRGKHRDGRLETRSVLRIVRNLGRKVGIKVWCHGLRHTSISQAAELGGQRGLGLHKVLAHSRHSNLATLSTYLDNHDRAGTQRTLADLVAGALPARLQP